MDSTCDEQRNGDSSTKRTNEEEIGIDSTSEEANTLYNCNFSITARETGKSQGNNGPNQLQLPPRTARI